MATSDTHGHAAGLFDIRTIIGLLLGVYGLIITGMGIWGDPAFAKTGGVNANLWAGLGLLVVGTIFLIWAKARPTIVPDDAPSEPVLPTD